MRTLFADPSWFLALLIDEDEYHQPATEVAATLYGKILTTEYIVVEVINYLSSPASRSKAALLMALETHTGRQGLVHHSDRGVQYASSEYIAILKKHRIVISMSRKGNPYDNAKAESFMKTLKSEEVSVNEYETFLQAKEQIGRFISIVYNNKRLHSALNYLTPAEFEAECIIKPFTLITQNTVSF